MNKYLHNNLLHLKNNDDYVDCLIKSFLLFVIISIFILMNSKVVFAEEKNQKINKNVEKQSDISASEESDLSYQYSNEICDFTFKLPKEPYTSRKCTKNGKCETVTNFTEIFNIANAVNFRIICKNYSDAVNVMNEDVLRASVLGMAKREHGTLSEYEINYVDFDDYKVATLTGAGKIAGTIGLYTMQLWAGHNSIMSFEGEVIGEQLEQADNLFADISASIAVKQK